MTDKPNDYHFLPSELALIGDACEHKLQHYEPPEEYADVLEAILHKVDYPEWNEYNPRVEQIFPQMATFQADEMPETEPIQLSVNEIIVLGDACKEADDYWDNPVGYSDFVNQLLEKVNYEEMVLKRPDELDISAYEDSWEAEEEDEYNDR